VVALRRAAAGLLVLVALGLLAAPGVAPAGTPVLVADAGVAALLAPGARVDLVGAGGAGSEGVTAPDAAEPGPVVLASGAVVLAVLPAPDRTAGAAPVVVVALPAGLAARVATASLREEVTVTLR
jgi:pilus assembly protein CpaB